MADREQSVCFDGEQGSVEILLERFEFPELTGGADANWIVGKVILTDDSDVRGSLVQPLYLRTDELEDFLKDLGAVVSGESNSASTNHVEEQYGIEIRRDSERVAIDAWVSDHEKRFEIKGIELELAQIADTHRQLAQAVVAFPAKGDPYGS